MKDNHFGYTVFIITMVVAAILFLSGCKTVQIGLPCPDTSPRVEEYLCSKYYADKEEAQTLIGSHDFFLHEEIHNVPILCGKADGIGELHSECDVSTCECVCHEE